MPNPPPNSNWRQCSWCDDDDGDDGGGCHHVIQVLIFAIQCLRTRVCILCNGMYLQTYFPNPIIPACIHLVWIAFTCTSVLPVFAYFRNRLPAFTLSGLPLRVSASSPPSSKNQEYFPSADCTDCFAECTDLLNSTWKSIFCSNYTINGNIDMIVYHNLKRFSSQCFVESGVFMQNLLWRTFD